MGKKQEQAELPTGFCIHCTAPIPFDCLAPDGYMIVSADDLQALFNSVPKAMADGDHAIWRIGELLRAYNAES